MELILDFIKAGGVHWEAIIAIVGAIGTSVMAWSKRKSEQRAKKAQATALIQKKENEFLKENLFQSKMNLLKRIIDIRHLNKIEKIHNKVFEETCIDRFTVLMLMNGKLDFNFMSVIYDMSKHKANLEGFLPYERIPIDDYYRDFVMDLPHKRGVWKHYPYEGDTGPMFEWIKIEKIKNICWYRVKRLQLDEHNDLFIYLSWSSESEEKPKWSTNRYLDMITQSQIIPGLVDILEFPKMNEIEDLLHDIEG